MFKWDPQDLRVLVVAPDEADEGRIVGYLEKSGLAGRLISANSASAAIILLRERPFSLLLLSDRLGSPEQQKLLREASGLQEAAGTVPRSALVPFAVSTERTELLKLIEAGAHGIVLPPPQPEAVKEVLTAALDSAHAPPTVRMPAHDQLALLPQILEGVAKKLDQLAGKLKEQGAEQRLLEASPKLVQEAILGALVMSGEDSAATVDRIVDFLLMNPAGQPQGKPGTPTGH